MDAAMVRWQNLLVDHGFAGRTIPKEYGGFGKPLDPIELTIIADEFAREGLYTGIHDAGTGLLVPTLLEAGTAAQCEKWVGSTIRGETIWCQGYSEPDAGSDLTSLRTRAQLEGDEFIINGRKIWTSCATWADMMFMLCRTEDIQGAGGISCLILPMTSKGIHVRPIEAMTGHQSFAEVTFDNVRVPVANLVGERGAGWSVAAVTLKHERLMLGSAAKLESRLQFIQSLLSSNEHLRQNKHVYQELVLKLIELQAEVMAAKYQNLRMLTCASRGEDLGVGEFITKLNGTTLAFRISELGTDVLGLSGMRYGPDLSNVEEPSAWYGDYMHELGLMIGGGTSQIQKNIIAERGLGLPGERKL